MLNWKNFNGNKKLILNRADGGQMYLEVNEGLTSDHSSLKWSAAKVECINTSVTHHTQDHMGCNTRGGTTTNKDRC